MPYFVVIARREKRSGAAARRSTTVAGGPFIRLLAAQYCAADWRSRDDVRALPPAAHEIEVQCFITEAADAESALRLGPSSALVWVVDAFRPWRASGRGGEASGDRAPRPRPGAPPSLVATKALPLEDDGLHTRFADDLRAYPRDWNESERRGAA